MDIGMTEENRNIFYLTGLEIQDNGSQDSKDVSYQSGKHVYSGRIPIRYIKEGTLPVRNLTPNVNRGLTLVEAVAGELFPGKSSILVHVRDLVTRFAIGKPYDELLTE